MLTRIGLLFAPESDSAKVPLLGVARYLRQNRNWAVEVIQPEADSIERYLQSFPAGLIAGNLSDASLDRISESKVAAVVLGRATELELGHVLTDEVQVGEAAVLHFATRGYRHFSYWGANSGVEGVRGAAFAQGIERQGFRCEHFADESGPVGSEAFDRDASLIQWLQSLPKPVAVFCGTDTRALKLSEVCRQLGLDVPGSVAILGTGDNEALCALGEPSLSSVQLPLERLGYEAAMLLAKRLEQGTFTAETLLLPPVQVVGRRSTDAVAASDRLVGHALALMRSHLSGSIGILEVCRQLKCSRRSLERRFSSSTGLTPTEAWVRFRVEEAQRLLLDTDMTVEAIATRTGFGDGRQVASAVRKVTGQRPSELRRRGLHGA